MIEYPKISSAKGFQHNYCRAFVKYDGTNVGFNWSKKQGWNKSRLRRGLFGADDPFVGRCIPVFMEKYSEHLAKLFHDGIKKVWRGNTHEISIFGETFGPSSFAGMHKTEEPLDVVVFDIFIKDFGFIGPDDFVKLMSMVPEVKSAKCIYHGKFSGQLAEEIRRGDYKSQGVFEGCVIKAGKGGEDVEMAKIKTYEYMEKLKVVYADKWQEFWE